jgi:hypothetical protein
VSAIASEFHWSQKQILRLELGAALHYAMKAKRYRWERFEDTRLAAGFVHLAVEADRAALLEQVGRMLSGPGIPVTWKEQLSAETRRQMDECERERDAAYAALQKAGVLCSAAGRAPTALYR